MATETDFSDLRERFIWVIKEFAGESDTGSRFLYGYLGERYGIDARKWKNVCNRVQQPSFEMIAALCSDRPHFLSWVLMGRAINTLQVDPTQEGWDKALQRYNEESLIRLMNQLKDDDNKEDK